MKRTTVLSALLSASLLGSITLVQAASPHPPGSSSTSTKIPSLGDYATLCFNNGGSATAESRNITVGSHNQQVAHLQAQNFSSAAVSIQNLNNTVIKQGIYFTLVAGSGDYLIVDVRYNTHDGDSHLISFVTQNSKLTIPGVQRLFSNGNGQFIIPVTNQGGQGVPVNSKLTEVTWGQLAAEHSCAVQTSDINNVILNSRSVPIDHSAPSSSCVQNCVDSN